jgi:putative MFS transporter
MSMIAARLERMPFARVHRQLLLMGGLGYTFDGMDGAIVAFVLPALSSLWALTSVEIGVLASANFIGYLVGAFCAGNFGDLIGRRRVMMWALAIFCLASLVTAFATSWRMFFWWRILAGVGTGAESAIVAPFLSEFVASRYRGKFIGALAGFFSFGFLGAAILGRLLVPAASWGWQVAIVITALPIVMLLWWRRALPESPRWLETRGRIQEAEVIVEKFEQAIEKELGRPLPAPAADTAQAPRPVSKGTLFSNLRALWSPGLARVTAMTWLVWLSITFCYYAFFSWIPSLMVKNGLTITKSFNYSIAIYAAQVPGYYSAAFLNERFGRQAVISVYMVLGGLSAIVLSLTRDNLVIMIAGVCLSFFMNGTYAGLYAYTPELFPTEVRATGMGVASSIGRIGAISAPIIVGYVFPWAGFAGVFGMTTVVLLAGAVSVLVLGVHTRGKSLEQIAVEELGGTRKGAKA